MKRVEIHKINDNEGSLSELGLVDEVEDTNRKSSQDRTTPSPRINLIKEAIEKKIKINVKDTLEQFKNARLKILNDSAALEESLKKKQDEKDKEIAAARERRLK